LRVLAPTQIDLAGVEEVKKSTAPGATEFEIELVTDERAYRFRCPNQAEMEHWMVRLSHFVG
jgi:c-di-GMP-binding flagellar brake protein YcgR